MSLSEYFENTKGTGVLATADDNGNVDVAIYARPHCQDEKTVAFIMNDRLSYKNMTSNPKAAYLFLEDSPGYHGKRLYLTKIAEETEKIKSMLSEGKLKSITHCPAKKNTSSIAVSIESGRS